MKMPPRRRRPIQMIARRRFHGLDCIMLRFLANSLAATLVLLVGVWLLLLAQQLIQKLAQRVVAHRAGVRISLPLGMENRRRRLIHAVYLPQLHVFIDEGIEGSAFD